MMTVRRVAVAAVVLVIASLLAPAAANAAGRTWFAQTGSGTAPAYRPHRLWISGDGAFFTKQMTWARWDTLRASGHGTAAVDDCKPYCAAGTYHYYLVRVRLGDPRRVCGRRFFTRIVIVYPNSHPPGSPSRLVLDPYRVTC